MFRGRERAVVAVAVGASCFRRSERQFEVFAVLGCCAAYHVGWYPTFRDNMPVLSSRMKQSQKK